MHVRILSVLSVACAFVTAVQSAEALPGTKPFTMDGDLSAQMVSGIDAFLIQQTKKAAENRGIHWKRDFSSWEGYVKSVSTNRAELARRMGVIYPITPPSEIEFVSSTQHTSQVWDGDSYEALAVRWTVLEGVSGEGLWLKQKKESLGTVIALPDADQTPEMLAGLEMGVSTRAQYARSLAQAGFDVFVPMLISRSDTFSGSEELKRFTNQPHREWIYRQAYELGGHIIGYEVSKVLALVDYLSHQGEKNIGLIGYGEGGLLAMYSAALDTRIKSTVVSGYFGPREEMWAEPIYRNVSGLLNVFGDAEIASMIAPRSLIIEYSLTPKIDGPPEPGQGRSGAAPGRIRTPEHYEVETEVHRLKGLFPRKLPFNPLFIHGNEGTPVLPGCDATLRAFVKELGSEFSGITEPEQDVQMALPNPDVRQKRQLTELVHHVQHQLTVSERQRSNRLRQISSGVSAKDWAAKSGEARQHFWEEVLGRFDSPTTPPKAQSRLIYDEPKWRGYDVVMEVWPNVFAWGILCVPKDLKTGERRPVVVCQHGLEGVPKDTIDGPNSSGYGPYKAFTARLAERGFITFAPHNPYRGQDKFRVLQRMANPIGRTLFSVIIGQHEQILNWLEELPFVDPQRIGFYGLSYGGKTAMRVPAVLERYALSICSADFNDWIRKNVTVHSPYSYMFTQEYDMPEYALGLSHNYSEMAALIAPRPFMVERGHDDGVAPDEWVAYEFAKVKRFYDKLGIGERTEIEFFNGPHTINGDGTYKFLHRHLNWPEPTP